MNLRFRRMVLCGRTWVRGTRPKVKWVPNFQTRYPVQRTPVVGTSGFALRTVRTKRKHVLSTFYQVTFSWKESKVIFFLCGFLATSFLGLPFKSCCLLWTTIITSLRDVNSYLLFLSALTTMSHLLVEGSMGFLQPRGVRLKFRVFLLLGLVLWRDFSCDVFLYDS